MLSLQIERYKHYIKMLNEGYINGILCHSKAGLGKTYTTLQILNELDTPYTYVNGVTTPLALYMLLYDNSDRILILDDVETLFQNEHMIIILKSAMQEANGVRQVSYHTSSNKLGEYPNHFEYNGKLIFLMNEIKGRKDESFKALISRCLKYNIVYTLNDIKKISYDIVGNKEYLNDEQKNIIKNIIEKDISIEHHFNFRLLDRLISFVRYDKNTARDLFLKSLDIDEEILILINIIKEYEKVEQQVMIYKQKSGKSRASFFRKKKQIKQEGMI